MSEHVKNYYNENAEVEWDRLDNPYSRVEYETTVYLMEKYLPKAGHIFDIGSGPGRYALNLLSRGLNVSLLDISNNELDIAKEKIEEQNYVAEAYYAKSALELEVFSDESFDGMLLMGPLYHLHHEAERLKVLKDTFRLLKKGGTGIISYINIWGVLKAGVSEFPDSFDSMDYFENFHQGKLKLSHEESFTTAFFTTPPIALEEVKACGFEVVSYAGAESFLCGLNMQLKALHTNAPHTYENFLKSASAFCEMPQYRDATEHIHIIVRKN